MVVVMAIIDTVSQAMEQSCDSGPLCTLQSQVLHVCPFMGVCVDFSLEMPVHQ